MDPQAKTSTLIGVLVVLVIVAGLLMALSNIAKQQRLASIGTFEECALAGYPIMESYPERCATPDGRTFVNEKRYAETHTDILVPKPSQPTDCVVGGCSAQLCGERAEMEDLVSTCEYRAEYACYNRWSACERQADGKCGWTLTPNLKRCLDNPPPLQ